jgi:hypothetical protein
LEVDILDCLFECSTPLIPGSLLLESQLLFSVTVRWVS